MFTNGRGNVAAAALVALLALLALPPAGCLDDVGGRFGEHAPAVEIHVWAWGDNAEGQLGDGTTTDSSTPVQVLGPGGSGYLTDVQATAGGAYHTIALKSDGTVWAWGYNQFGELGDGTTTDSSTPVQVLGPGGSGYLTAVQAIAGGEQHTIAIK